jgi:hypothetical protein
MLTLLTLAQYPLYSSNNNIVSKYFNKTYYELLSYISMQITAYLLS